MTLLHWVLLYAIIACLTILAAIEIGIINPVLAGVLWTLEVGPLVTIFLTIYFGETNATPKIKVLGQRPEEDSTRADRLVLRPALPHSSGRRGAGQPVHSLLRVQPRVYEERTSTAVSHRIEKGSFGQVRFPGPSTGPEGGSGRRAERVLGRTNTASKDQNRTTARHNACK